MSNEVADLALQIVALKLATREQSSECQEEEGRLASSKEAFVRAMERRGYLTPYQTHKLLKGDSDGYFFGNYRLLYKIASGSFGRVFRADDPATGTVVAVKVLRRRWNSDARSIELFEREAKVGMSMRHPNIVSILSMSRDMATKQYFIVLEFVEGGSLKDFLTIRKKLEATEALKLIEDAAAGLAYAFSRGITHRDMKLTNIMISSQGEAKLVDFGLAGVSSSALGEEDSQVDRSVDYAGLERATGVKTGDVRSDIYFLGCVLYEMLTGRSPLEMTKDKNARMQKARFENAAPITQNDVNAPPAVLQLVETMMALQPQRRYQTPAHLLEAIRSARRGTIEKSSGKAGVSAATDSAETLPPVREECVVFVVEKNQRLQEVFRDKFKEMGYRVLLSIEPSTALSRFHQQPYDALLVDAGAGGEEELLHFEQIMTEANRGERSCAGILLLSEAQAEWAKRIPPAKNIAVLIRPLNFKQLAYKLFEFVPPPKRKS